MTYYPPQLQFFQEFERAVAAGTTPLYSTQVGPLYALHRYDETDEQALVGDYDRDSVVANAYVWPDHVAGAVPDLVNAEVWLENAIIRYFQGFAAGTLVADNSNQIDSGLVFKTNAYADRSAPAFGSRDVQVGDLVRLDWLDPVTGDPESLDTSVAGLVADVVPGTLNPDNRWATSFGSTVQAATESVDFPAPTLYTVVYNPAAYAGLVDGYPEDLYTIRVLAVGVGTASGGTLDGTELRITSAGGDTQVDAVLGEATAPWNGAAYEVALGARGAVMTVVDAGAGTAYAGQYWQVTISQTYTETDVTSALEFDSTGPFTGARNTQYSVTVVRGGEIGVDDVIFGFRTNNGTDISGQLQVDAADYTLVLQNDYPIGNYGMTLTFFINTQWNTGDVLVFDVLAPTEGAYHTLVVSETIPTLLGTALDIELRVGRECELLADYLVLTVDDITVMPYAFVEDDLLGVVRPYALISGSMYADYRELRTDLANTMQVTDGISSVETLFGPAVADNPLGLAVYLARLNSGSTEVYAMPVESYDQAGFVEALDALTLYDTEVWSLNLLLDGLTAAEAIKDLLKAHVLERSNEDNNQWRVGWTTNPTLPTVGVYVETPAEADLTATITEQGAGLYRRVTVTGGLLITNEVTGGDTLRINYATDADGVVTYDEYTVDRVISETVAILTSGPAATITVPVKVEFWRTLDKSSYASELSAYPVKFGTRRMLCVYQDGAEDVSGNSLPLMYVAAALSGQRSGISPHAPMSELTLSGIYATPVQNFNKTQLNTIASGGNWIVHKDSTDRIYTRHQVTTAIALAANASDLLQQEGSFTSNADDICRTMYPQLQGLVGEGNVSPDMLALIKQRFNSVNEGIRNRPYTAKLGPQIQDVELTKLAVHPVHRDTVLLEADYDLPSPMNKLQVTLKFGAA